jgi:hypothetical protein
VSTLLKSGLQIVVLKSVAAPLQEKERALKKSWQDFASDIDTDLLAYLAKQQLTLARWRAMSNDGRSRLLDRFECRYPGGNWLAGWTAILDTAAGEQLPQSVE